MKKTHGTLSLIALLLLGLAFPAAAQQYTLQLTPSSLTFSAQAGSTTPLTQTVFPTTNAPAGTPVGFLTGVTPPQSWLSVSPGSGSNLPASFTVAANPSGLQPGTHTGKITVFIAGAQTDLNVTLNVGQLSATPSSVSITHQVGAAPPTTQPVQLSSAAPAAFRVERSTTSGGDWLEATPATGATAAGAGGTATATLGISIKADVLASLAAGTYAGKVTVTPTSGVTVPLEIPVTLRVNPVPALTAAPAALSFAMQQGVPAVTEKEFTISTVGSNLLFTAAPASAVNWLTVFPTSGLVSAGAPVTLRATVLPGAVGVGTHSTEIVVSAAGATPVRIPVSFRISASPLLTLTPLALEFTYQIGDVAPAENIATASTSTAIAYTVTTATPWIDVRTPTGNTPNPIAIGIKPTGLGQGTYTGSITVSAPGNPDLSIPVSLKVNNDPIILAAGTAAPAALPFVYQTGQQATAPPNILVPISSSTGAPLNYTASTTADWITALPTTTGTPGVLVVAVNPTGLAAGLHEGAVRVTATNPSGTAAPNSPLTVPVKLHVSSTALLYTDASTPIALGAVGGAPSEQKNLAIYSTGTAEGIRWTALTATEWLAVGPNVGTTGISGPITVRAYPGTLAPGKYTGSIQISGTYVSGGSTVPNSPVTVPVILTVAAGSLQLSSTALTFTMPLGGSAPAQNVTVGSSAGNLGFTATASANWITVTPASGATPGQIAVGVNPAGLPQGTHQGSVTVTAPGAANSPQTVQVNLAITAPQTVHLTPAAMQFNYQIGGQTPAAQTTVVSSSSGSLNFTAAASTTSGGNWLSVEPASGPATPANLTVRVNPANLPAGRYEGSVTVTSAAASNSPQRVAVVLNVAALPPPAITAVANAASWAPGAVAPGEIIVIGGNYFGPVETTTLRLTPQGTVQTTLAETQVLFDNIPAPLVYVSGTQISAIVPYEIAGRVSTRVQVRHRDVTSAALELRVADAAPGIFAANQAGSGQGSILNQDYSVNSAANPAAKGSVVMVYATGEGQTDPRGITGRVTPNDLAGVARPVLPVTVTIGGRAATVHYAGSAPGFVAGVMQLNIAIPSDAPSGSLPVVIGVGGINSQSSVTVAVR